MNGVWTLSIRDFLTKKMLGYALVPFFGTLLILYALFFSTVSSGLDALQHQNDAALHIEKHERFVDDRGIVTENEENTTVEGASSILRFLMEHAVTSWLVSFIVYTVGTLFVFIFAIFVALIIIGFLTPYIVAEVKRRHYPDLPDESHGGIVETTLATLKYVLVMIVLFFVLTPLYFIPVVNYLAFNLPFYYFFHKMYLVDVASETMSKERFKELMFYRGGSVRMTTLTLYAISLIPLAAFITPVFNVIVLTHTLLRNRLALDADRPEHVSAQRDEILRSPSKKLTR